MLKLDLTTVMEGDLKKKNKEAKVHKLGAAPQAGPPPR